MPSEVDRSTRTTRVEVVTSATLELTFAVFSFLQRDKPSHRGAWLARVRGKAGDLEARMGAFADGLAARTSIPCDEWGDVMVLLDRAGMLVEQEPEKFFRWLRSPAADFGPVGRLDSESDEANSAIQARLAHMAGKPEMRARLADLLEELWVLLRPEWLEYGRELAEEVATEIAGRLARGDEWSAVVKGSLAKKPQHAEQLQRAARGGRLLIAPLGLHPEGQMLYTLPGATVMAFGPEAGQHSEARKERAEAAAKTFKLLSDPTRNAILMRLLNWPASVTELANTFDLAQPTVSVHIKVLREAGLLEQERAGNLTLYRANARAVREAINAAGELILAELSEQ